MNDVNICNKIKRPMITGQKSTCSICARSGINCCFGCLLIKEINKSCDILFARNKDKQFKFLMLYKRSRSSIGGAARS